MLHITIEQFIVVICALGFHGFYLLVLSSHRSSQNIVLVQDSISNLEKIVISDPKVQERQSPVLW